MSSSVFTESQSVPKLTPKAEASDKADQRPGNSSLADSNLVVVYGKNGINFDRKGLENLIEEKTLTSISVIRLTSPTPSMVEAEEKEAQLEEMMRRQTITSDEEIENTSDKDTEDDKPKESHSSDEEIESAEDEKKSDECEADLSENEKPKPKKRGRKPKNANIKVPKCKERLIKPRPQVVGLSVEEFYPSNAAKEIAKQILREAGVSTMKRSADHDFQMYVIKNDHCYTPFTSPTQMKAKLAAEKLEAEKQAIATRKVAAHNILIKQLYAKKNLQQSSQCDIEEQDPIAIKVMPDSKMKKGIKYKRQQSHSISDEFSEHCDDSYSSALEEEEEGDYSLSEESAETDNDRDSDLDFDISNPKGRKRKVKLMKKAKRAMALKHQIKRREQIQDESEDMQRNVQKTKTSKSINNETLHPIKPVLSTPTKNPIIATNSQPKMLSASIAALPPIPKKQHASTTSENKPSAPSTSQNTITIRKGPVIQLGHKFQRAQIHSSHQNVKEIVINKVISSPKGVFTDINTLLKKSEDHMTVTPPKVTYSNRSNRQINPSSKGFMLLGVESASNSQLPAQISIHTHQSSSELAAENDKQLDLIDSIVKSEMEKSSIIEKPATVDDNIPVLVKMLESTERALELNNTAKIINFDQCANNDNIDIQNVPLLEKQDHDLPEDLLQHVVELIEDDKTLEEAVEKDVFGDESSVPNSPIIEVAATSPLAESTLFEYIPSTTSSEIQLKTIHETTTKSIIQISISNAPNTTTSYVTPSTSLANEPQTSKMVELIRKEPVQVIRGNGRVITLPPIEAPTTRAKRRALVQPSRQDSINSNESILDITFQSNGTSPNINTPENKDNSLVKRRVSKEGTPSTSTPVASARLNNKSTDKKITTITTPTPTKEDGPESEIESEESHGDDDDPNKLWCICRQPHNNRFMICCDVCEDWFHGTCVSITKAMGLEMEQKGTDWTCPKCVKKLEEKKQRKITDMLQTQKKPTLTIPSKTNIIITKKVEEQNVANTTETSSTSVNEQTKPSPIISVTPKKQIIEIKSIETGHFITLKNTEQTKKSVGPVLTSGQKKLFFTSPKDPQTHPITSLKRIIVTQHVQDSKTAITSKQETLVKLPQHQQVKVQKVVASSVTPKKLNDAASGQCIVCKRNARSNSIYCSDDCIRKHAQTALNSYLIKTPEPVAANGQSKNLFDESKKKSKELFEDLLSMADRKPKAERVNVYERKSGRILFGNSAPTTANLKKWLQENPTFEVVLPGSLQATEIEKRQKQRAVQSTMTPVKKDSTQSMDISPANSIGKSQISKPVTPPADPTISLKVEKPFADQIKTLPLSPAVNTPKAFPKYPQQVSLKPDKPKIEDNTKLKDKPLKRQNTESVSKKYAESVVFSGANEEPIRLNVRHTLKNQMLLRMKEQGSSNNSAHQLTPDEVEDFVAHTESEMYNYFNHDAGAKYKAKYRSLVFNIKDRKNLTLFEKICAKIIGPKQLVRMSPDELASQELAQWRENEAKHQLEIIKKSELDLLTCTKNYVLKTHKGEEVIEGKSGDLLDVNLDTTISEQNEELQSNSPNTTNTSVKESISTQKDSSKDSSSSYQADKSNIHNSNSAEKTEEYRIKSAKKDKDRSRDRTSERERRHKSKDHHKEKSRSRKRSRSHSRSRSRSRDKRYKSSHKHDRRERDDRDVRERGREREHRDHERREEFDRISLERKSLEKKGPLVLTFSKSSYSYKDKQREITTPSTKKSTPTKTRETFSLIDQILESTKTIEEAANFGKDMPKENTPPPTQSSAVTSYCVSVDSAATSNAQNSVDSDQEPTSTVSISTPPQDPYSMYAAEDISVDYPGCNSLWSGNINMIDVTSFQIILQPVIGNFINLGKLLPNELDVVGRIGAETVWDYISKIKKSPNKEIVITRLLPLNESETSAYTILYEYLDKRKRLGVIKTMSPLIKDFYIFPLGAKKQMPSILRPIEKIKFYEDPYRPDILVGIVIRVIGKRSSLSPHSASHSTTIPQHKITEKLPHFPLPRRVNDGNSFTPPGSPKRRKMFASKEKEFDIDAIIKAPIGTKMQKPVILPTSPLDDADEPYSPGGSSDDDIPMLPTLTATKASGDDLKRKMDELNKKIAAQEKEIAGLLNVEPAQFGATSTTSKVLANISIPSNLSQILASIKNKPETMQVPMQTSGMASTPPPPIIGSLITTNTADPNEEYDPEKAGGDFFTANEKPTTSRLAQLSEAELLSMVPDDMIDQAIPSSRRPAEKKRRFDEPPPPGV